MTIRSTPAEISVISGYSAETHSSVLDAAIKAGSILVDNNLVGQGLSDDMLKLIEQYLAAHFTDLSVLKGPLAGQVLGQTSEKYHDIYSAGLNSTRFGQQAVLFDTTGILSAMSARAVRPALRALFTVIGTPDTDEEDALS